MLGRDDDRDLLSAARWLVSRADGRGVCAPVGALGEVLIKVESGEPGDRLNADDLEAIGRKLAELVREGRITVCGLGAGEDPVAFFRCALEVRESDDRIGNTDVLTLASALCSPDCQVLYTNDQPMLTSSSLGRIAGRYDVTLQEGRTSEGPRSRRSARRRTSSR